MNSPVITKGWLRVTLYLVSLPFTIIISSVVFIMIFSLVTGETAPGGDFIYRENIYFLIFYQLILLVTITLLTLFFRKFIDNKTFVSLGFYKFQIKKDLLIGILTGFACIGGGFAILFFSGYIFIETIDPDPVNLAASLMLYLMVSWIEEISFRGYILNNLMESLNPYAALLISSLLFALFHIFNPGMSALAFTNLFLAGMLLGVVFIYTKTIWFALSLHFSWNYFQGPVFGFNVSGVDLPGITQTRIEENSYISGGEFGFEGSVICSLLVIISILLLHRLYKHHI